MVDFYCKNSNDVLEEFQRSRKENVSFHAVITHSLSFLKRIPGLLTPSVWFFASHLCTRGHYLLCCADHCFFQSCIHTSSLLFSLPFYLQVYLVMMLRLLC